jgi:HAD superfamily hydrolase (TIGR01509 family)
MRFDAVIFDSDGVLVDSELLGNQVLVDYVAEFGLDFPLAEAVALFTGAKMANTVAEIESRLGRSLPSEFVSELRRRMAVAFRSQLQPINGVGAVVESLRVPFCVASNGPREKMEVCLQAAGLLPFFQGRLFSAYEVGIWKPDPGLFLHAARALGVEPTRCAVIEDSVLGTRAGVAAGMVVFGYAPAATGPALAAAGAHPFVKMADLPDLLCSG